METASAPQFAPSLGVRLRHLLPLYIGGLVVTLCGIGAVQSTVDDPSLGTATAALTLVGFAVSIALRLARVDPNLALYPAFGLGFFLAAQHFITAGGLTELLGGTPQHWQPDVALATFLCWLVVLRSFTLLTNYALLFCPVPTIALLGLTGSSNQNTEILVYFLIFLFSTIFVVGYEHYLRLQQSVQRDPEPILRAHTATAVCLFLMVAFAGCLLTVAARPALSRLSPFTGPLLRKAQQLPAFNQAMQAQSNYVPVGSGPIDLSQSPVMDVYAPEGGLWRTRVMDFWNGRGWSIHQQQEGLTAAIARQLVPVPTHRPRGLPREEEYPPKLYVIPLLSERRPGSRLKVHRVPQQILIRTPLAQAVPAAPRPVELHFPSADVQVDDSGVILARSFLNSGFVYEVVSDIVDREPEKLRAAPAVDPDKFYEPAYLDLPSNFDRVQDLARRITRDAPAPYDKAMAIQEWLERNCAYTLQEEAAPAGQDAVDYYVFTTKEGACDLVGSAMALMCRSVGIPARVAVGYSHDEPDPVTRAYHVSQADAHLWVELWFPGYGWITFNPAPTPRQTPATAASSLLIRLRRLWRSLTRGGMASALSALLLLALVGVGANALGDSLRTQMRGRREQQRMLRSDDAAVLIPLLYRRMCALLAAHGWPRPPTATPHEYLATLRANPDAPPALLEAAAALTERFTAVHYGAASLTPAEMEDARGHIAQIRASLRSEGKRQKAEGRRQKAEGGKQ